MRKRMTRAEDTMKIVREGCNGGDRQGNWGGKRIKRMTEGKAVCYKYSILQIYNVSLFSIIYK